METLEERAISVVRRILTMVGENRNLKATVVQLNERLDEAEKKIRELTPKPKLHAQRPKPKKGIKETGESRDAYSYGDEKGSFV